MSRGSCHSFCIAPSLVSEEVVVVGAPFVGLSCDGLGFYGVYRVVAAHDTFDTFLHRGVDEDVQTARVVAEDIVRTAADYDKRFLLRCVEKEFADAFIESVVTD